MLKKALNENKEVCGCGAMCFPEKGVAEVIRCVQE